MSDRDWAFTADDQRHSDATIDAASDPQPRIRCDKVAHYTAPYAPTCDCGMYNRDLTLASPRPSQQLHAELTESLAAPPRPTSQERNHR